MNQAFRQYVFGRAFTLSLSDRHIELLTQLCQRDDIASYGFYSARSGLLRRGLIEHFFDGHHSRIRPTKAGLLTYDLLVEAGEYARLEDERRRALDMANEISKAEWDEKFGAMEIKLKDVHRRDAARSGNDA